MVKAKYIVGGLLLVANLFLSTYYDSVIDIIQVNHPYDLEPYSVRSYWFSFYLHLSPLIYLIVFTTLKVDWGVLKWCFVAVVALKFIDFYLAFAEFLIEGDVVNYIMLLAIVFFVGEKVSK